MRHPDAPRGVDACLESLEKRRAWVTRRNHGGYDVREGIALGYAIALLRAAVRLGRVAELEQSALEARQLDPEWLEQPNEPKGA